MKLDIETLEVVIKAATEFARREWRAGEVKRSDTMTDFISGDLEDLMRQAKEQEQQRKADFEVTLRNVREAMQLMQTHCIGCTVMVTEGPRSYTTPAEIDERGRCKICGKPRYKSKP